MTLVAIIATLSLGWCAIGVTQESTDTADSDTAVSTQQTETKPANDPYQINAQPEASKNIGVDSQTGEFLVMDIPFHDEENRYVKIGDYFDGKRPVLLSFNYSDCPKLCSVQLENMTDALRQIKFKVKEDFQVVSISIDPNEQTSRAKKTKALYVERYSKSDRQGSDDGWHFLTGEKADIDLMADICGFRYKYVPSQKLFSHPPVFILISPEGKIVRYIHGLTYEPKKMELAFLDAAKGKIGSPMNILSYGVLSCFTFNESTGKYTLQAMAVMRIGGATTAFLLAIGLVPYWFFRRGRNLDSKKGLPLPTAPASSA